MPFLGGRQKVSSDNTDGRIANSTRSRSVHGSSQIRSVGESRKFISSANASINAVELSLTNRQITTPVNAQRLSLRVQFLDRTEHMFNLDRKSLGHDLLNRVFDYLDLREPLYFGLMYCENESCPGSARWLDPKKMLRKQLKGSNRLYFRVKFFSNTPEKLIDEFTRYLYVTQLRREIRAGNIYVDKSTAVKLAALLLQADYGDFNSSTRHAVVKDENRTVDSFMPMQNQDFLRDVKNEHTRLTGLSPASADLKYLEIAKSLEMYGVEIHHANVSIRDTTDLELKVGVCSKGIVIFQGFQKISQFAWDRIAKLSFRRRHFFISLMSADGIKGCKDNPARLLLFNCKEDFMISLVLPSYQASKALWKSCVAHHAFFRSSPDAICKPTILCGASADCSSSTHSEQHKSSFIVIGINELYRGFSTDVRNGTDRVRITSSRDRITASIPNDHIYSRSHSSNRSALTSLANNDLRRFKGHSSLESSNCSSSSFLVNERRHLKFNKLNCAAKPETCAQANLSTTSQSNGEPYKTIQMLSSALYGTTTTADQTIEIKESSAMLSSSPDRTTSRFPSPTPSKVSVYSLLSQSAAEEDYDSSLRKKAGLFIEPYKSVFKNGTNVRLDDSIERFQQTSILRVDSFSERKRKSQSPFDSLHKIIHNLEVPLPILNECINGNAQPESNLGASMQAIKSGLHSSSLLSTFDSLYRSKLGYTSYESRKHENYYKNRYKDVIPYDQTRVILRHGIDGDYINANHINIPINSIDFVNKYIATQGPLPTTTDDFWQMVWEQDITLIVMLTTLNENGRTKCHKYWPDLGELADYGRFQLRTVKEHRSADNHTTHRELMFKRKDENGQERMIKHSQCESWPDHGVPSDYTSFLDFVQWIRTCRNDSPSSPVLVHCSAGIGRTGVIILAETALCLIDQHIPVYPMDIVKQMRNQRYSMVQTRQQFQFACEAILYAYRRHQPTK